MAYHKNHTFLSLCLFVVLSGCTWFSKTEAPPQPIVDPLVERNQQWREHVEQGNSELRRGNLPEALLAYQAAVAVRPDVSSTQQKIAEIYFQLSEYEKARDAFLAFLALEPNSVNVLNYVGYISEKLNDYHAAAQYYEHVLTIAKDNLYALNHLGLAYKQLQRLDEAVVVLRKALALDLKCQRPESQNLHNYLGLIYLEKGEVGEAVAELRESIRLFPNDVWARQQLASLYEDRQRYYEAQLQYQELLKVAPDNLFARTRLQALAQMDLKPVSIIKLPPVNLLSVDADAHITNAPDAETYPGVDALILFNHFSHDVLPTGQSRYTTHQVVKLLTAHGIEKYNDIAIPYQPKTQNIQVNIARTIDMEGTVHQPPEEAFNDVTPPGLLAQNLYSDAMWHVISMVALTPGVCIEYQVTLEDKTEHAPGAETWVTGGFNFQSTEVTLQTQYALRIPPDWTLQWKTDNFKIEPDISSDENGNLIYRWQYGETPALVVEDGMPAINDIAPRLTYSSIPSWNDVYLWYKQLAAKQYAPDAKIEAAVLELTKFMTTKTDKIRAIYDFVASRIRYVGIELGQSAYQPTPAVEVFRNQYGDCKDKTTLLISMLELVGIPAYPVLINPAPYERIDTELPSLNQFSHMLAAVPDGDNRYIWLDATSQTCSYGDLPYSDQGRTGFLIGDERGEFVEIPIFPAAANRLITHTEFWLKENGDVEGKIRIETLGQYNLNARWTYQQVPSEQLKVTLATELSQQFPGIQIEWCDISDLGNLNLPVTIELGFQAQNYATAFENQMLLPLPIDEFAEYAQTVAAPQRTHSLDFGYPTQLEKEIRIHLPEGWTAALPLDIHHVTDFAELVREYRQIERTVTYRLTFTLKTRTIPAAAYAAARRFFTQLASEDRSRLLLNPRPRM